MNNKIRIDDNINNDNFQTFSFAESPVYIDQYSLLTKLEEEESSTSSHFE